MMGGQWRIPRARQRHGRGSWYTWQIACSNRGAYNAWRRNDGWTMESHSMQGMRTINMLGEPGMMRGVHGRSERGEPHAMNREPGEHGDRGVPEVIAIYGRTWYVR